MWSLIHTVALDPSALTSMALSADLPVASTGSCIAKQYQSHTTEGQLMFDVKDWHSYQQRV